MTWLVVAVLPYFLVFLLLWARLRKLNLKDGSQSTLPADDSHFLSVIIPLKNEAGNINELISDLSGQSLDADKYEVIFVDDKSSDPTPEILKKAVTPDMSVTIIEAGGKGKKSAIALGIDRARGNYIVTTDGDCRVGSNWLLSIYEKLTHPKPDMVIGAVDIIDRGSLFSRFVQLEFLSLQAITEITARTGRPVMCNGANLCFSNPGAGKYLEMVKENIKSGDDIFLMERYKKEGKHIIWNDSPDNLVFTHGPYSLSSFFRQRLRWTSKSPFYTDTFILAVSSLVFLTNLLIASVFIAAFFLPELLFVFLLLFLLKSIPDLFILVNIMAKRSKKGLLILFIPAQVIYPFYVTVIGLSGIIKGLFSSQRGK